MSPHNTDRLPTFTNFHLPPPLSLGAQKAFTSPDLGQSTFTLADTVQGSEPGAASDNSISFEVVSPALRVSSPSSTTSRLVRLQRPEFGEQPDAILQFDWLLPISPLQFGDVSTNISSPSAQPILGDFPPGVVVGGFDDGWIADLQPLDGVACGSRSRLRDGQRFPCDKCPQSFSRIRGLTRHKHVHHPEKPSLCNYCRRSCLGKCTLMRHVRARHRGKHALFDVDKRSQSNAGNDCLDGDGATLSGKAVKSELVEANFVKENLAGSAKNAYVVPATSKDVDSIKGDITSDVDANWIGKAVHSSEGTADTSPILSTNSPSESVTGSDDGNPVVLSREQQNLAVVNRLMRYFYAWLNPSLGAGTRGHTHSSSTSTSPSAAPSSDDAVATFSGDILGGHGLKRRREEPPGGNDDDPDEEHRRGKRPKRQGDAKEIALSTRKLACPYYKREPSKYQNWRSCPGPGWDTVHRLKEHLYRRHTIPIRCNRCRSVFKSDGLLNDHQRASDPCPKRDEPLTEGLDRNQEKLLRSRKKSQVDRSEPEKWADVYIILFPKDPPESIPTPYYELQNVKGKGRQSSPSSAELERYQQFLRNELPSQVRQKLVEEIEKELDPVEEKLKSKLPEIVLLVHRTLFETYQGSRNHESSRNLGPIIDRALENSHPIDANDQMAWWIAAADDQLAAFLPTPFTEDFAASFDADMLMQSTSYDNIQEQYDPGYHSMTGKSSEDSAGPSEPKVHQCAYHF